MQHGLKALAATLSEGELTKQNVSIAIVGAGAPFVLLDDDDVEPYVSVGVALSVAGLWLGQYAVVLEGVGCSRGWVLLCNWGGRVHQLCGCAGGGGCCKGRVGIRWASVLVKVTAWRWLTDTNMIAGAGRCSYRRGMCMALTSVAAAAQG